MVHVSSIIFFLEEYFEVGSVKLVVVDLVAIAN
jgi:hypothetical protein